MTEDRAMETRTEDRIADSPYPYFAELVDRLRAATSPSPEPPE